MFNFCFSLKKVRLSTFVVCVCVCVLSVYEHVQVGRNVDGAGLHTFIAVFPLKNCLLQWQVLQIYLNILKRNLSWRCAFPFLL